MRRFFISKVELEEGEVGDGDMGVDFLVSLLLLLHKQCVQILYLLIQLMILLHSVDLMKFNRIDSSLECNAIGESNRWFLHFFGRDFFACFSAFFLNNFVRFGLTLALHDFFGFRFGSFRFRFGGPSVLSHLIKE